MGPEGRAYPARPSPFPGLCQGLRVTKEEDRMLPSTARPLPCGLLGQGREPAVSRSAHTLLPAQLLRAFCLCLATGSTSSGISLRQI